MRFRTEFRSMLEPDATVNEDLLDRVRIVLSHTTKPGNIGASARALKTMGLSDLVLVAPTSFPDRQADFLAAGATDMLEGVRVCEDLDRALSDITLAIALSARRRDLAPEIVDVREAAQLAAGELTAGGNVAFVFGTEISGLTNEEVLRCQRVARIATSSAFASLNLAAAVQVVAHEMRYALLGPVARPPVRSPAATHDETEGFFAHLQASLARSGFLDPDKPRRVMQRLRRLFGRACLESQEVNILRGMLSAWDERRDRAQKSDPS
jgi:tRNA/rRNA methyltransferase